MINKICPILTASVQRPCHCHANNCAWFDDEAMDCALTTIADHLDRIAYVQEEASGL